jgi:hypothetical protein
MTETQIQIIAMLFMTAGTLLIFGALVAIVGWKPAGVLTVGGITFYIGHAISHP